LRFITGGVGRGVVVTVRELLDGMIAGDDAAWREFLRKSGPIIGAVCRRAGLNRDETDDVAQRMVLKFLENNSRVLRKVNLVSEESFYGWVKVVVSRTAIDLIRRSERRKGWEFYSGKEQWNEIFESSVHDGVESKLLVEHAVKDLTGAEKVLLHLDFNDLRDREIAKILDMPVNTVQVKLSRLRKKMRRNLQPE